MSETTSPDTRTCAWTGKEFEGRGYILRTTEHPEEIVSEAALRAAPVDTAQQLDHLTAAVNRLTRRVSELENPGDKSNGETPRARKAAAGRPSAQGK